MAMHKQTFTKLREFGLNSYEAKLWMALLSRGVSTAGELSDIANVPRSRSYDVLESLEKKGFIIMKVGKPIKYLAVHPDEVIERVKKVVQSQAEQQSKQLEELRNSGILTELKSIHTQGLKFVEASDLAGIFRGRKETHRQIDYLLKHTKKSACFAVTVEGASALAETMKNPLARAKDRSIRTRVLITSSKEKTPTMELLKTLAEVRFAENPTGRFFISDQKDVVFFLADEAENHPNYDSSVWAEAPCLVRTLQQTFELEWEKAKRG